MLKYDVEKRLSLLGLGLHTAALGIVLLAAGAGYVFILRPMAARIEACEVRSAQLAIRLKDAGALQAEHEELNRRLAALMRNAELAGKRVPPEPLEAEFLSQVAAMAGHVGLKILDYRPGVASPRDRCSQMEIQLSCSGPYRSLCHFLDRLGALERLSRVAQAEITAAGPEGCTVSMTLVVFFGLKKPTDAAGQASPLGEVGHG